ncbi:cytochrome c oxidase subunit viia superfamily [Holotrichia oblita]|uniref:Cytochrome c oxidase subunit viia superfamily n=1 Tax=Holotrichia oblita TaxID=644536 RepID=A0ACB9TP68_HOLOL|nr:cytochrome c oxidase subunit viia superfamily [Holotrichia oblita]
MNASRKTFALTQLCVRQFSQTAVRRSTQTEVASSKFPKLKEGQKLFGVDDHQLVHVKAGFKDKALYQATVVLTVIGLGLCGDVLVRLALK